ncbi:MAG: hypothetical protein II899_06180 [Bacteroidales bacterium]|nr:hypothetical protein [Bacteroidales bacterium]
MMTIAAREKVETRVFVARRETGVGFNEPADNQKLKIYNLIIMDKSGSMSSISDGQIKNLTKKEYRPCSGIAGFRDEETAPLFVRAINLDNIHLPQSFWKELAG